MADGAFELNTAAVPGMVLPFSAEAEQSVLGAVLLEPSCLSTVAELLPRAEYFYQVNNRLIYGVMLEMFTAGKPVDLVTLLERLREEDTFDEGSGKVYLMQLAQLVPSISNVEEYCMIVRDKFDVRMLIQAARGILDDATEGAGETALLLDSAEQRIFDIRRGKSIKGLQRLNEVLFETFERLDRLNSPDKDLYRGIPTGIRELDNTITGLNRSDLIIMGARPGMARRALRSTSRGTSRSPATSVSPFSRSRCRRSSLRPACSPQRRWSAARSCAPASSPKTTGRASSRRGTSYRRRSCTSTIPPASRCRR